jgi:TetR/AcrR family transcriptional regulator, regulator of cefoperazone and chloramphenicol sensitivity
MDLQRFMTIHPGRADRARSRLLAAAIEVFGEKGPKGATVREIASVAGQNVAAIAYYFGSKEKLYATVLEGIVREIRYQLRDVLEKVQALQKDPHPEPAKAARTLKEFLQTIYLRLVSRNEIAAIGRLIIREQLRPTAGFEVLYAQGFRGLHEALCFLVGASLGKDPASRETMVRTNLIMGQVYFFAMAREATLRRLKWKDLEGENATWVAELLGEHVDALLANLGKVNQTE